MLSRLLVSSMAVYVLWPSDRTRFLLALVLSTCLVLWGAFFLAVSWRIFLDPKEES